MCFYLFCMAQPFWEKIKNNCFPNPLPSEIKQRCLWIISHKKITRLLVSIPNYKIWLYDDLLSNGHEININPNAPISSIWGSSTTQRHDGANLWNTLKYHILPVISSSFLVYPVISECSKRHLMNMGFTMYMVTKLVIFFFFILFFFL